MNDVKLPEDVERTSARGASGWLAYCSSRRHRPWPLLFLGVLAILTLGTYVHITHHDSRRIVRLPKDASLIKARCENLKLSPGPPPGFSSRATSDRFVPGTKSTLIRNATIWTGNDDGKKVVKGDVLLDKGLIRLFGTDVNADYLDEAAVVDADGGWITPGLSIAGGVTTAIVLPGSANDIGGQAFSIKLRPTKERSPTSMLLEPPFTLNSTNDIDWTLPPRWRQMKHACGENPRRVYGNSRMDNIWSFREIYDKARQIKGQQDAYCERVLQDDWNGLGAFPEELQHEALVDVLRGRVKVQVHCYETVDLGDIVRLTNEFKFPIAAFHHAHEMYLVPDLLKKAYGHTPASAMFATNARYKRESFRGSEFAACILADNGLPVVFKSDHPVLDSRYLLYEAQQGHYYGLPDNLAIASVTSTPATMAGLDHRIGFIRTGYDADIVLWDSHPLALGATAHQVFIDGIAQFDTMHSTPALKPEHFQNRLRHQILTGRRTMHSKYEGLPPLEPKTSVAGTVIFTNITSLTTRSSDGKGIVSVFERRNGDERAVLVARAGKVVCAGSSSSCSHFLGPTAVTVDLKGGAISPGLITFGSNLGLEEIEGEASTKDGLAPDPLDRGLPSILGEGSLIRAVDGLEFATRHAYLGYRAGVTVGVSSPSSNGFLSGLSTAFGLGSAHKLEEGALLQDVTAVHISIGHSVASESVSTQVAALRRLLLEPPSDNSGKWFEQVAKGKRTLVVHAESLDVIATLVQLKKEVEENVGETVKLTIAGGSEAHTLAPQLAQAGVGIITIPSRPFPEYWEKRRIVAGPPITADSAVSLFLKQNVTVGILEPWSARNTRFDVAWAALDAGGDITKTEALALASTNLENLLGLDINPALADLVATESGDLFEFESKVVAVIAPRKGAVNLF